MAGEARGTSTTAWRDLTREIESCTRCPLHASRTHAVVYRGAEHPRVLFVGEAPGAEEDRLGRPFVGRSGRVLDAGIAELGVHAEPIGIVNLLKCRPPGNVYSRNAAATCRPYLDRQIALLSPRLIVSLGARALTALDGTAPPITQASGRARRAGPWRVFPLLHPAATFRSRRNLEQWHRDLDRLRSYLAAPANG